MDKSTVPRFYGPRHILSRGHTNELHFICSCHSICQSNVKTKMLKRTEIGAKVPPGKQ